LALKIYIQSTNKIIGFSVVSQINIIRFGMALERDYYLTGHENELNVLLWAVSAISINESAPKSRRDNFSL
jgi:hypothetical protein